MSPVKLKQGKSPSRWEQLSFPLAPLSHLSGDRQGTGDEGMKDIVFIRIPRLLETVRGHQNGARKIREFPGLILLGRSVMAVQMGVLF